jgi:signal transduction histidine kinase
LLLLIFGSFWWYSSEADKLVQLASQRTGRGLIESIKLRIHMKVFGWTQDESDLADFVGKDLAKKTFTYELIKPNAVPGGANQGKDPFDFVVLDKYRERPHATPDDDRPPFMEKTADTANGPEYYYYEPIRAESGRCIICHNAGGANQQLGLPEWEEGDLMAVVKVILSDNENREDLAKNRSVLVTLAIITVSLAIIVSWGIVRYVIVKPLRHLRDVSDEVSRGNTMLRAEIHTGDEFESLAVAFNRMLRHLTQIQDELRNVNVHLDLKVDELAQANMRLYEMNRVKSDFLATMSHELRTPLNAIIGFSDVLGAITSLDDKQKRYVKNIQTSGRMLLEMINDILDLAKIDAGKMDVRLTEFRIDSVVSAQCDMSRPLSERKNIDLESHIEPELPPLLQDQSKVQQILNNLLSNAIKFTPEGGRVTVSARRDTRGDLELIVADTGVGIAEEEQQIVFEKFRQGKSVLARGDAMTREYSGTGLGLSIVKEMCRLLGGEISLRSELGKGSSFTVTLPWSRIDSSKADAALTSTAESPPNKRIDLVESVHSAAASG